MASAPTPSWRTSSRLLSKTRWSSATKAPSPRTSVPRGRGTRTRCATGSASRHRRSRRRCRRTSTCSSSVTTWTRSASTRPTTPSGRPSASRSGPSWRVPASSSRSVSLRRSASPPSSTRCSRTGRSARTRGACIWTTSARRRTSFESAAADRSGEPIRAASEEASRRLRTSGGAPRALLLPSVLSLRFRGKAVPGWGCDLPNARFAAHATVLALLRPSPLRGLVCTFPVQPSRPQAAQGCSLLSVFAVAPGRLNAVLTLSIGRALCT
mmetsp:Transcript_25058/g.79729  ORF Transcript_25058/g.79729 Transcript_25058/m.79729 type:complete len:268 (+) Transcript_25058:383-1186(+)